MPPLAGPGDPPLQGVDYQTLCAGEMLSILQGQRGVVMVQLYVGWDLQTTQPAFNPFVVHLLRQAAQDPNIVITLSKAPEGLGLTALLSAKKDPFKSWSKHLASFGAQASLIAESPYYKLLIGRVMGYKEENIQHHILETSGRPVNREVMAAVEADLLKVSSKKPAIPWNVQGARGKKK